MRTINFCNLWDGSRFKLKGQDTYLVKIGNSHAREEGTGKDVIPSLSDKCMPCGRSKKYYDFLREECTRLT